MSYPITDIEGIDGDAAARLKSAEDQVDRHACSSRRHAARAARSWPTRPACTAKSNLLCWANMADRMRIKGVSKEYAELLQAAGVETVQRAQVPQSRPSSPPRWPTPTGQRKLVRVLPSEKVRGALDRATPRRCR